MKKTLLFLVLSITSPLTPMAQPVRPLYLFSHGIADSGRQAYLYAYDKSEADDHKIPLFHNYWIINNKHDDPIVTFDFPDSTTAFWRVNGFLSSLAQKNEVVTLKRAAQECQTMPIVGIGVSRGAATLLNYTALYNPPTLKALVLESPYDHINSVVQNALYKVGLNGYGTHYIGQLLFKLLFWRYSLQGPHPIDTVEKIDPNLPILLICSKEDQLVPYTSTITLYNKLKENGHHAVHLLVLDHGKHAKLMDAQDAALYQNVVHAFYKQYNLEHDPELAQAGWKSFQQTSKVS